MPGDDRVHHGRAHAERRYWSGHRRPAADGRPREVVLLTAAPRARFFQCPACDQHGRRLPLTWAADAKNEVNYPRTAAKTWRSRASSSCLHRRASGAAPVRLRTPVREPRRLAQVSGAKSRVPLQAFRPRLCYLLPHGDAPHHHDHYHPQRRVCGRARVSIASHRRPARKDGSR
jgi:hypothetical protein